MKLCEPNGRRHRGTRRRSASPAVEIVVELTRSGGHLNVGKRCPGELPALMRWTRGDGSARF
jgi:hypothetical protein